MGTAKSNKHPGLYKRGRYWWITRDPVEGRAVSTRCTSLKAAIAIQSERERLAADPAYAASQTARLSEQCSRFVALKRGSVASTTLDYMALKLGHWVRVFGDDAPLASLTPPAFDRFVQTRRDEGASDHTISKEVKIAISMLKSAKRVGQYAGDIETLRPEYLKTSYVPRERAMTMGEVEALLPHLRPDLAALLCVSVALGLRRSEALKLAPDDIDLDAGVVSVRGTKTAGSRRIIPILSPFRALLEAAIPALPIGALPHNLYRDVNVACKQAGVEKAGPNDWRRSHATILAESGAAAEQTRKLLGHTSTQMVDRVYARPSALALGRLIEGQIERSAGVVEVAELRHNLPGVATAKCAESYNTPNTEALRLGLRSQRSVVRIHSGAQVNRFGAEGDPGDCSKYVASPALWALASAAHRLGILPREAA